jgi:hypothetical protein
MACAAFFASFLVTLAWWRKAEPAASRRPSRWRALRGHADGHPIEIALLCMIVFGGSLSFLALAKEGSAPNQMQEVFLAAASLSTIVYLRLQAQLSGAGLRSLHALAILTLASMAVYPALQVGLNRMGPITRVSSEERAQRRGFGEFLAAQPAPLFIRDEIFSLPWFSNAGRYPAIIVDPIFYFAAQRKGRLEGGGLAELVREHWFASLYLEPADELYQPALVAGYRVRPIDPRYRSYPTVANGRSGQGELLVLTPETR